jgi:class 3 adenylate cyclase
MTISFCDMKDFTRFSEGVTPAALVTVLNRYMTLMSEPVRRSGADKQARLACFAALDQLAGLALFRELPDLIGLKRGFPEIDIRIGIATGGIIVGNIGSEQARSYTVIGDTVPGWAHRADFRNGRISQSYMSDTTSAVPKCHFQAPTA